MKESRHKAGFQHEKNGASDEARTRYLHLGKVALYQMSYTRSDKKDCSKKLSACQEECENLFFRWGGFRKV